MTALLFGAGAAVELLACCLVLHPQMMPLTINFEFPDSDCYLDYVPFFFFFQAEDGIRDRDVTGVQTCALPIWSRTNTSATLLVSPGTRLVALEVKTTKRPSPLIPTPELPAFPWFPALSTLTRSVVPACRSPTNTSATLLVSPGPRLVALELKTTKRTSPLIPTPELAAFPWFPALSTLTRSVVPVCRSRTNTSSTLFVSPRSIPTRRSSDLTKRPSPLIPTPELAAFPWFPALSTLTRSVVPASAAAG